MARISRRLRKIILTSEQLQAMVKNVEKECDILALYLYGSYGTKYQTELSDVDLALLPMAGTHWKLERELELFSLLAGIARNDDINLINLRRVPVTLQMRVLETGRLMYVREEALLADFRENVIRRYCDFEPDLRQIYRDFDAGLREEFL